MQQTDEKTRGVRPPELEVLTEKKINSTKNFRAALVSSLKESTISTTFHGSNGITYFW